MIVVDDSTKVEYSKEMRNGNEKVGKLWKMRNCEVGCRSALGNTL